MIRSTARAKVFTVVCLLTLVNVSIAFSQAVTGTILGRVTDATGAVVPGVMVQIQNVGTGYSRTEQTDSGGRYLVRDLPLGTYTVTVQQSGFRTEVKNGIAVTVASETTLNFQLSVGNVQEKVEVTAEAPTIETTNATLSGLVSQDQIRDLPLNGRSVDQLALLSPGVFQNRNTFSNPAVGGGVRLSVNGSRPDSMLYLLDGVVTNDSSNNGHGSSAGEALGVESILEFRLLTHSFSAEYGRFAGGVVSAVTRSGTNEFHGSIYEFVRNNIFDARNFFNPGDLPAFRRNQFGAAAGGRIIKDRIFFFANYEGLRQRQGVTVVAAVPDLNARNGLLPPTVVNGAATCSTGALNAQGLCQFTVASSVVPYLNVYPVPNGTNHRDGTADFIVNFSSPVTEDYAMQRMDFRLSDKDNFYFRNVFDPSSAVAPLPLPTFQNAFNTTDHLVVLSETHVFSGASLNEFRFGFNRSTSDQISSSLSPIDPSLSFVPGKPFGTVSFSAASQSAGSLATLGNSFGSGSAQIQNSFEESDTFSIVRGAHSLKFGADFDRQDINYTFNPQSMGTYLFGGLQSFLLGQASTFRVLLLNSTSFNERGFRRINFGTFVQDDWRVRPNLTLNLGLREEFFTNPAEVNGFTAALRNITDAATTPGVPFTTPKLNLGPRVGLAWDPTGSGKTSVRAGGGIFYNNLEGRTWIGQATQNPTFYKTVSENNPPFPNAVALGIPLTNQVVGIVDYNSKTPTVIQYNVEVQQRLASTLSLRVGYVGSRGYHLSRLSELNLRIPQILANGTPFFPTAPPAATCTAAPTTPGCFFNPHFSNMSHISTDAVSNYNGLQVTLQKTLSAGLTFQTSYTYSKAMADADLIVTGQANSTSTGTMVPSNPLRDYSRSAYDQRHLFVFSGAYQMPWDKRLNGKLAKATLGGWVINTIFAYDTGIPMTPLDGFNRSQNGDSSNTDDRPDLAPGASINPINGVTAGCAGIPAGQHLQTATRWFDPCAFNLQTAGFYGNLGRNTITAPGLFNMDFTLVKTTPVTERIKLEFRTEFFNLLNHANFGIPLMNQFSSTGARSGNAGQVINTTVDNREIQLGLKLVF